ncbi:MAG: type II and III secretion system family protein [Alphaproteobacteria bacterium]|nr:type II and III secretion system family protein [Alphaproteobacteria bacterium]
MIYTCFLLLPLLSMTGCDFAENTLKSDREGNLEKQDFRDALSSRISDEEEGGDNAVQAAGIPDLQPYVSSTGERMKAMPLVSISINQSVPIRDALFELAQQANYDIELDPRIRGAIIFTARERPFDEVIRRMSEIAGLRYKFEDDVLRVELDTPYNKVYKVDYLSYIRSNTSGIRNDIAVVSGEGADTGSKFESLSKSEADFWGELETNLEQIVRGNQTGALKTRKDPRITATEQNADVRAVAPTSTDGKGGTTVQVQPPQATLRVDSLPLDDEEDTRSASKNKGTEAQSEARFTINRQAGMINVYASEAAHKEVDAYLKLVRRAVTSQVLIEAKILEVTLDDEFATGIDWRALGILSGEVTLDFLNAGTSRSSSTLVPATAAGLSGATVADDASLVLGYTGNDIQSLIQAVSGFGTVRALASPRLTVLNNQSAILNVSTNRVFFEIDIDVTTNEGDTSTDISSDIRNVPEGVLVNVQPSINLDSNTVSLALRPTITRVVRSIPDPAIQFVTASAGIEGVQSLVPEINVQEIDSVIQVRSGQPVVMGGLLQDRIVSNETGVPVLSEAPLFGALFRDHRDHAQKTELVVFLKATILENPAESVHNTDKDLYRQFSSDRRPFKL